MQRESGTAGRRGSGTAGQRDRPTADWFDHLPPTVPSLKEYSLERRRKEEYEILGFIPMLIPCSFTPSSSAACACAAAPSYSGMWAGR